MTPTHPTYEELKQAVLTAHGANLSATLLTDPCLEVLVDLGIVVHVGGGLIAATSHGERLHTRLQRGEHIAEFEPRPAPRDWSSED